MGYMIEQFRLKHDEPFCDLRTYKKYNDDNPFDSITMLRCDFHGEEIQTYVPYMPFCYNWVECAGRGYCNNDISCNH